MRKFKRIDGEENDNLKLFKGPVVIEEKYNVFPVTFSLKGPNVLIEAPKGIPATAADFLMGLKEKLVRGWSYYAGVPFGYSHPATNGLILFDVERADNQDFIGWSHRDMIAVSLGVEPPQLLFEGQAPSKTSLFDLLHEPSSLGGGSISGLVIKNYNEFDEEGKVLVGKLEGLCS